MAFSRGLEGKRERGSSDLVSFLEKALGFERPLVGFYRFSSRPLALQTTFELETAGAAAAASDDSTLDGQGTTLRARIESQKPGNCPELFGNLDMEAAEKLDKG